MNREPKLPHVLCGLSFCEACHVVRQIPVLIHYKENEENSVFIST